MNGTVKDNILKKNRSFCVVKNQGPLKRNASEKALDILIVKPLTSEDRV